MKNSVYSFHWGRHKPFMMEPLLQVDHLFAAGKFDDAAAAAAKESHRSSNIQSADVSKLLSRRSESLLRANRDAEAGMEAETLVKLKPNWSQGYQRLGEALMALQEFEEAEDIFKKGLSLAPDNKALQAAVVQSRVQTARAMGNAAFQEHSFVEATKHYSLAIRLCPEHRDINKLYSNRSACFYSLGDFNKALSDAEAAIGSNPTWGKGFSRKGGRDAHAYSLQNQLPVDGLQSNKSPSHQQSATPPIDGLQSSRHTHPTSAHSSLHCKSLPTVAGVRAVGGAGGQSNSRRSSSGHTGHGIQNTVFTQEDTGSTTQSSSNSSSASGAALRQAARVNSEASARPIREYSKEFVRRPSSESNGEGREGGFIEEERDTQRDTQKGISGARLGAATKEGAATDEAQTQERAHHPTASASQSATVGACVGGGSSKFGKEGNYSMTGIGMREHVLPQAQAGVGLRAGGSGGEKGDNAGGGTGGVGAAAAWNVNRESVLKECDSE